ncbi:uncharacterized protein CDV56_100224, partial [Aspergillus thermomutatus]
IGRAFADTLIQHGCFVIVVGRRQEHLDAFVEEHGVEKAASFQFDINRLDAIPSFAKSVTSSHPDLDCVFVNSGIQRRSFFSEPGSIDINDIQMEMTVNYVSYVALAKEFLPFLLAKDATPTSLIFTSSNLALVPILRCSNYCASKAALHQWILCLREQLKGTSIKVIEIFPPIVHTELHDEKHQPDMAEMVRGRSFGMPVEQFTQEAMQRLLAGDDQIPVGLSNIAFNSWEQQRQAAFRHVVEMMRKAATCYRSAPSASFWSWQRRESRFEFVPSDFMKGAHKLPAYTEKHPFGLIPLLEDGTFRVFESRAIARYIATKFQNQGTPLTPAAGDLQAWALFDQWASVEQNNFYCYVEQILTQKMWNQYRGLPTIDAILDDN